MNIGVCTPKQKVEICYKDTAKKYSKRGSVPIWSIFIPFRGWKNRMYLDKMRKSAEEAIIFLC